MSDAQSCPLCPRMTGSRRVLTERNGDWSAKVVFLAEAPGRLGAEKTGIPLFGDRTGDRFEQLLEAMGWRRSAVFITNAVLCNPRDKNGNNDQPSTQELANCSTYLKRTLDVINPVLVIALGRVALESLKKIQPHECTIQRSCGIVVPWGSRYLGVLYHPSPRTQTQRAWNCQIGDAVAIAKFASRHLDVHPQLS